MSTWKCQTALFVLTAHQQLIPQSFSLSPLNCFAKKQKQEKKIHQFIFFIAGEWSYSTLTFRVATVLIIASSALVSVRYFRFAPSADTWKLFFIKNLDYLTNFKWFYWLLLFLILVSCSFFTPYWLQSFPSPKLPSPKFTNLGTNTNIKQKNRCPSNIAIGR